MVKKYISFLFIAFNSFCFSAQISAQNSVFNLGDSFIGVVNNNRVKFYENFDDEWEYVPEMDMRLPNGYKSVFGVEYYIIGVVINNRIRFYEYDGDENWEYVPKSDMRLPNGYEKVFGMGEGLIGVLAGNRVQFYEYDDKWEYMPELDMRLSGGYSDVFCMYGYIIDEYIDDYWYIDEYIIGVVYGSIMQFYVLDDDENWEYVPKLDMKLPYGYKNVFFMDVYLAVVVDGRIIFYDFIENSWFVVQEMKFNFK